MILLDYVAADTVEITADHPVGAFLAKLFQNKSHLYTCLWYPGEDKTHRFHVHMMYLPTFMELLRSEQVTKLNQRSASPTRAMTPRLHEELVHWETRREMILDAKSQLDPPAEWNPLGSLEVPLKRPLRPYQRAGVAWMLFSENGILNDDVGAGKTCQAIGYCLAMLKAGLAKKILILTLKAVALQWESEGIQRFVPTPWDAVQVVDRIGWNNRKHQWRTDATWTITNYEKIRIDIDQIEDIEWDILLLDEGQACKNSKSQVARAVKRIKKKNCFILTATAIDTHLEDLYSLMQVVHPCILGNKRAFRKTYILENGPKHIGYYLARIRRDLPEKIAFTKLGRTKAQVLTQLPAVQEAIIPVTMEPDQARLYLEMEAESGEALDALDARQGSGEYLHLITKLLRLQQIANAPEQFDPSFAHYPSGKILALKELLETFPGKVLIFSFYEVFVSILYRYLSQWVEAKETSLTNLLWITGQKNDPQERERVKNEFNHSKERTCLVSTDCMKAGVNMACAEVVINMDLSYSPATMKQRVGRAHRLGMDEVERLGVGDHVFAYSLIAQNTLETRIPAVLAMRQELADHALADSDGAMLRKFNKEELRFLLKGK